MGPAALATNYKVFVAATLVNGVSEAEAACALGQEGSCLPAADGDKLPEHTYPGAFHQFESFSSGIMEGECYR